MAAGAGGVVWTWTLAQDVDRVEAAGRQSAIRIDRLEVLLDELARDELTYAASGQADSETLTSTSDRLRQIVSDTSRLIEASMARGLRPAVAVTEHAATLADADGRARENMEGGREAMAAALLFSETTRARQLLREQLRALRVAESQAVAEARSVDLKYAWMALAAVALLFAWALMRSTRRRVQAAAVAIPAAPAPPQPPPVRQPQRADAAPSINLTETAALCTAISRLQAEADLPDLLVRTATLLRAPGVVVWLAAGEEMFPVAWHGYDARQLRQLGPIARSSLNATAAAWRTGTLQSVSGGSSSRSAVVAPILGVDRCIGVLSIEVAPGREADTATQAVTSLIAAQFATVLGAWPGTSPAAAPEVLPLERASASS
jgi:hypothetical protein